MTTLRTTLITGLAALSLGGAMLGAQAQTTAQPSASQAGHPKAAPSKEERRERHAESAAKHEQSRAERVARLHDELRITPAQENAWNAFVASMKPLHRGERGQHERAEQAGLSAPERAERMIARQKERTAAMEQRLGALNSFYAVLSPEQKKMFDEKAARMQHHSGRHGGWRRHGDETAHG